MWIANTQLAALRTTVVGGGGDNARRQRRQLLNGTDVVVVATLPDASHLFRDGIYHMAMGQDLGTPKNPEIRWMRPPLGVWSSSWRRPYTSPTKSWPKMGMSGPPSPRKDHDIFFYIKKQSLRSQFNTIVWDLRMLPPKLDGLGLPYTWPLRSNRRRTLWYPKIPGKAARQWWLTRCLKLGPFEGWIPSWESAEPFFPPYFLDLWSLKLCDDEWTLDEQDPRFLSSKGIMFSGRWTHWSGSRAIWTSRSWRFSWKLSEMLVTRWEGNEYRHF